MQRKIALVVLTLLLAVANAVSATVPTAEAQPRFPSSFYGYVTLDGQPVADGTTLEAFINGVRYMQTTTRTQSDGQAAYTINVPHDDPMTTAIEGGHQNDTITFIVGGRYTAAQRGTFLIGQNTALNLTASTVAPTPTPIPTPTPRPSPTATPTPVPTVSVPLYAGWNAIAYSGPAQNVATALTSVTVTSNETVIGPIPIVYHYNNQTKAWESYDPALPPFANSLRQFQPGEAYWISARSNLTLRLASGAPLRTVPLYAGWNMTTYFGESQPVADILAGALPEAMAIYVFNNQSKGWSSYRSDLPPFANSMTNMSTGTAFWVYVPRTIAWSWLARGTPGDNATVSKEFYLGYTRLCITVTSGGTPVQGADVAMWDDLGNEYLGTTDASGDFCVNLPRGIRTVKYHIQWKDSSEKWHVVFDYGVDP